MFVCPKPGIRVRDPVKKDLLPDEGREVAESMYWHRRIADGDVVTQRPNAVSASARSTSTGDDDK